MIIAGFLLLLTGLLLSFIMVLQLLEPSFPLCFLSYLLMLGGLVLGLAGIMQKRRSRK